MSFHEAEESLRFRRCHNSACNALFAMCRCCDRGQRYCSAHCRQLVRHAQAAAAGKRYQASDTGKIAHCRRQRRYRQRLTEFRVTHQGTHSITRAATSRAQSLHQCAVCGRISRWHNPFDLLPRQPFRRSRTRCRADAQISTFSRDR
jgi:hypothetical protein